MSDSSMVTQLPLDREAELDSLEAHVQNALRQARIGGASAAEVSAHSSQGLSATVRLGEVETLEHTQDRGIGVTVFVGRRKGSASSADLRREALDVLERGPAVPEEKITFQRYTAVDQMDNALDVAQRDPASARLLATEALSQAVAVWFIERGGWMPRAKDRLSALRGVDPEAADAVEKFIESGDVDDAESAIGVLLGVSGFFEWESIPEP